MVFQVDIWNTIYHIYLLLDKEGINFAGKNRTWRAMGKNLQTRRSGRARQDDRDVSRQAPASGAEVGNMANVKCYSCGRIIGRKGNFCRGCKHHICPKCAISGRHYGDKDGDHVLLRRPALARKAAR